MRRTKWLAMVGATLSAAPACSAGENAAGPAASSSRLGVACRQETANGVREASLVYEGGASGVVTIEGAFGAMKLPATRSERTGEVGGQNVTVVGVEARGPALVAMPDKMGMERCLVEAGADPADRDLVAYHVNLCQADIAPGAPAAIDAVVTIAVIDAPDAEVFISRTFREESAAAGGRITLDSFPPLACKVS